MGSGNKLGRYEVVRHLASGGMAEVSIARDGDRHVVVKRIRDEQAEDDRFVSMFIDEARLAASLSHPNIVKTYDIGQQDDELFFAMEYVHGEDARKLLMKLNRQREKLPLEHVVAIVSGALAGLHHAHESELQIVHRDVSPANILVGYDGIVKVADFGIAKAAMRTSETRSGTLKGKVSYMSPEQCTGRPVDRRSDIFAIGIVLYELSTVRRLFKGENDFMTMTTIVQGNVPKPTTVRPDLPHDLEDIIMTALAVSPDKRYATALEMRGALEAFAAKHKLVASTSRLAAFMQHVFGIKPLPWLAEEEGEIIELTVDFDGSASGIAASVIPEEGNYTDSAPIGRAKTIADATGWNATEKEPTMASGGTPIAWSPETQAPAASRKRWLYVGIGGVVAALLLLFVVSRSPSADDPLPEPPAAAQPKPLVDPPAATASVKVDLPPPPKVEPKIEPPVGPAASAGSAGSGSAVKPKIKRPPRPAQPPSGPTPKWDPNKLFPDKKK